MDIKILPTMIYLDKKKLRHHYLCDISSGAFFCCLFRGKIFGLVKKWSMKKNI